MNNPVDLSSAMQRCGLIAILRGVTPDEVVPIGQVLVEAGFSIIEVPLKSPDPLQSIRALRDALPPECVVGAGTVTRVQDCTEVAGAGGSLIVMPHSDAAIIRAAKAAGMYCAPGVATLTEAYAALAAGADVLKLFPAEALSPAVLKAWRAVLRPPVALVPVGGIVPGSVAGYAAAGASGFGLGSALYKPGDTPADVARQAAAFMQAWRSAYDSAHDSAHSGA